MGIWAVTGTHGTGKTTAAYDLARRFKIDHPDKKVGLLSENCIQCPYPINKETTCEAQMWIFANQLQSELDMLAKYDWVISDRTVVDAIAYSFVAGLNTSMMDGMVLIAQFHCLKHYDRIIFHTMQNNDYNTSDGLREAGDMVFRLEVEEALKRYYMYGIGLEDIIVWK